MAIEIVIKQSSDVTWAVDQLHDYWLDVGAIDLDRPAKRVRIPFAKCSENLKTKAYDKWLVVEAVQKIEIHDTEKVGFYDLDRIAVKNSLLEFRCGVPLRIEITVGWEQ
jgi:hypothetical protein